MDQGTWQGIGTVLALMAFSGICWWAFSARNKSRFEEASRLPFVDDVGFDSDNSLEVDTQNVNVTSEDSAGKGKDNAGNGL